MSYNTKDNGWMSFDNVKVPRNQLLGKYVKVERDGEFKLIGDSRIMYSSMMYIRGYILNISNMVLYRCAHTAIRYSHIRTQFKDTKDEEIPLIDYQLQRSRVFPVLAKSYVTRFALLAIEDLIKEHAANVKLGNMQLMKDLHTYLCGAKSMWTNWANDACFAMMQAMGGHGYSISSGIGSHLDTHFQNAIYEGDNTVLLLQVSVTLLKNYNLTLQEDSTLLESMEFLRNSEKLESWQPLERKSIFRETETYLSIFEKTIFTLIKKCAEKMINYTADEKAPMSIKDVLDLKIGILIVDVSKIFKNYFTAKFAIRSIQKLKDGEIKKALTN